MGYFPTGVTIVTSWQEEKPAGATINAICSVSLEPPMLLICLGSANTLLEPIKRSGVFGVNILDENSGDVALRFAKPPEDTRFDAYPFRFVDGGAPQLETSPVFVDCVLESVHAAGDHFVLIGRGVRTDRPAAVPPLLYHKSRFSKLPSAT
ncbi:MAG TPA: flavin reductase family protein [Rhizomicrobium sp.]|nr:flavin reductase family protein [Rhizomicrobium sp.]